MPLVNMSDMLNHAYCNGYAVVSFDVISLDLLDAIINAAEATRSPVILSISESISNIYNLNHAIAITEIAAKAANVPVAIQFNHGTSYESAVQAINAGCNGVMVDSSHQSFPTNVANISKVVKMAHNCGIAVEGELGNNIAVEDLESRNDLDRPSYTAVAEAKAYVERTNVDFLAVAIGTSQIHSRKRPKPDFDRLKRINGAIKIPLVIHDSGRLTDEQVHKMVINGVAKINYHTDINNCASEKSSSKLRDINIGGYTEILQNVRETIQGDVERCMINWGSAGRAAEVLERCQIWSPIQHVIIYNVNNINIEEIETIMTKGQTILSKIPGVRRVTTGTAVNENARYKFCWLIEFVHKNVIGSYRDHPDHIKFANELFRPIANDRISIDYSEGYTSLETLKPKHSLMASA